MVTILNYFKLILTNLSIALISFNMVSQVVSVDSNKVYKNLDEALKNPNDVFHLKLTREKRTNFPKEILLFKNLKTLDLSRNKLTNIPYEIRDLKKLEELKLNKNKFNVFPSAVCQIITLKKLEINNNEITAIPKEINQLKKLIYLDMWSNDLYDIPEEMGDLVNIQVIDLRNIQFSKEQQKRLIHLLPKAKIHLSNSCNCAN